MSTVSPSMKKRYRADCTTDLSAHIADKREFIDKFRLLNNIVMPKENVYKKLIDIFRIEDALFTALLDDLNNNFHLYSIGFPGLNEMLIIYFFNDIVISGAVNFRKPDHSIFHLSLSNLNSSSERTVFVGDNLEADIIPCKEVGMRTILKSKDNSSCYPDAICDDLMEIPALHQCFFIK